MDYRTGNELQGDQSIKKKLKLQAFGRVSKTISVKINTICLPGTGDGKIIDAYMRR